MTRLDAALAVLRTALGGYLARLHATWGGASDDVGRLLAGTGLPPEANDADRAAVEAALAIRASDEPLADLVAALDLDTGAELLVAAAWWAETDPQVAVAFGCGHDDGGRRYASCALLRLLLAPFGIAVPPEVDGAHPLVRDGVLAPGAGPDGPLRLTATARRLLAGVAFDGMPNDAVPERHADVVAHLAAHLDGAAGLVVVRGPAGTRRRALAAAAIRKAGREPVADERPDAEQRLLARLGRAVPVVPVARLLALAPGPAVGIADPDEPVNGAYVVDLAAPGPHERRMHWLGALLPSLPEPAAVALSARLAARFAFTEADIDRAAGRARTDAAWHGRDVAAADVWHAARRHPEHALARLARLVAPAFDLDDLALADDTRAQLEELVAHVTLQDKVLDDWGFRARMPRGQGVAALFSGPPGTGKTMAAEAVSNALGQDLYTVDLSAVVSKYIGETEKNLEAAFAQAEKAAAVLFFDECDALFGKRTEQHDARDRWANLEVNYLLQRVETFTGLVILATNKRAALDEAFLRRLRFSIRFDLPTATLRRDLWERAFPSATPTDGLDWTGLAQRDLTGGTIQVAAVSAAFRAAARDGAVLPEDVEHALRREYEKLGKAWQS
ncbi:MAG: hypothetical protein QOE45_2597 [Frankiaceae bacterium]|nr:hypothetical protein [Frankiaceae bacterium]